MNELSRLAHPVAKAISHAPEASDSEVCEDIDNECPICTHTFGEVSFSGRTVIAVIPHCNAAHRVCEECITTQYQMDPIAARSCSQCRGETMPLVRADGAEFSKDSPFYIPVPVRACLIGDREKLAQLIEQNPKIVNETFYSVESGGTASLLGVAVKNGHTECVSLLLSKGANVNGRSGGKTPLYSAAEQGHQGVLIELLNADVKVDKKSYDETPLFVAVYNGYSDCIPLLIARGADINAARKFDGATPLHAAAYFNDTECLQRLMEFGRGFKPGKRLNLNALDQQKCTPLYRAVGAGASDMAEALITAGAHVDVLCAGGHGTALHLAAAKGNVRVMNALINKGANVNACGNARLTPLHVAVFLNRLESVNTLVREPGIDLTAKDAKHLTALDRAADLGFFECWGVIINRAISSR